jgi:hypothetical protein
MRGRATMPTETFAAMRTREFRTAMGIAPGAGQIEEKGTEDD